MKRNLAQAEWLRPSDIQNVYGISRSTVSDMVKAGRLAGRKVRGKSGRRGMLFIKRSDMDKFMAGETVGKGAV